MNDSSDRRRDVETAPAFPVAEIGTIRNPELVEQRRGQILDAAQRLFLEKGYAATTIRDICAASGVNQASLYDYVANKQDILRRLFNRMHDRPESAAIADRRDRGEFPTLEAYLAQSLRHAWGHNREAILLAYRTFRDLAPTDRRIMLRRDRALVTDISAYLQRVTGLAADDRRLGVVANLIVHMQAFAAFRDWNMREIDDDALLHTVVDGLANIVRTLTAQPPDSTPDGEGGA
jgi:AcrR family transcriptional regulator